MQQCEPHIEISQKDILFLPVTTWAMANNVFSALQDKVRTALLADYPDLKWKEHGTREWKKGKWSVLEATQPNHYACMILKKPRWLELLPYDTYQPLALYETYTQTGVPTWNGSQYSNLSFGDLLSNRHLKHVREKYVLKAGAFDCTLVREEDLYTGDTMYNLVWHVGNIPPSAFVIYRTQGKIEYLEHNIDLFRQMQEHLPQIKKHLLSR